MSKTAEELWKLLLDHLHEGKVVKTFKEKETFKIVSFSDESITVRLTSKEKEVTLSKKVMLNAIKKLLENKDGVRQKMVDPEARLKLGLLSLLPMTEKEKRLEDNNNRWYLLLYGQRDRSLVHPYIRSYIIQNCA